MPNWTTNDVTIKADAETVAKIKAECFDSEGNFDFETLIPFPEGFDKALTSGSDDMAYDVVYGDWNSVAMYPWMGTVSREDTVTKLRANFAARGADLDTLAEGYKRNVELTGHKTWYEWCTDNWGTKWNACETSLRPSNEEALVFTFSTAWREPTPVFEALHAKYPSAYIRVVCEHEGDDSITGHKYYPDED